MVVENIIRDNTYFYSDDANLYNIDEIYQRIKSYDIFSENGVCKEKIHKILTDSKEGIKDILLICGISTEFFKRVITFIRLIGMEEYSSKQWDDNEQSGFITEWNMSAIHMRLKSNSFFSHGVTDLLFDGKNNYLLKEMLPDSYINRFSLSECCNMNDFLLKSLVNIQFKGSSVNVNNQEYKIKDALTRNGISYSGGILFSDRLRGRKMDIIIPDKENPKVIVECSFMVTTSSSQGDKSKTEMQVRDLMREEFPKAIFVGFIDGIGWLIRKSDLDRMVSAFDYVFTFSDYNINKFIQLVKQRIAYVE